MHLCITKSHLYACYAHGLIRSHKVKANWHPFIDGGEKSHCQLNEYSDRSRSLEGTWSSPSLLSVFLTAQPQPIHSNPNLSLYH